MSNLTSHCKSAFVGLVALLAAALPLRALPGTTDLSSVPLPTYATGSSVDVKPNILMVLDDSGSMDWDYLPDWANDRPPNYNQLPDRMYRNSSFNGVGYNPAIVYLPPVTFTSGGAKDTGTYPSMAGTSAATGANTGSAMPNWKAVKNDGFGVQFAGTKDLQSTSQVRKRTSSNSGATWTIWADAASCTTSSGGSNWTDCKTDNGVAWYYLTLPGEYCDSPELTNCTASATPTGNYQYPAPLRWCTDTTLTSCRAVQDGSHTYPRMPGSPVSTITFTAASSANVTGITVGGVQIMSAASGSTSSNSTLATSVVAQINACTYGLPAGTACGTVGYSAYVTGASTNVVYILAPGSTSATPSVAKSGTLTSTITAFANQTVPLTPWLRSGYSASTSAVPGTTLLTVIHKDNNSYTYPGSATKAAARTDCAGTTCTYREELANYANWYAYYRTRMQMMKTATSRAFSTLDTDADITAGTTRYRVGYMSINNNTGTDFANITDFDSTQKFTWFSKLLAANPNNSTPLRVALSDAGRLYGGKFNGTTFNGVSVVDPLQYSCQRNYTILSTDGFWNGGAGYKLDGSTAVGNQDGGLPRPYNDGGSGQNQTRTAQLQQQVTTQQAQVGTLQKQLLQKQTQTNQLQVSTSQLQSQTSTLQSSTSALQTATSTLQRVDGTLQSQTSQLQKSDGTLQSQTSTLQRSDGTLQSQTAALQRSDGTLQTATSQLQANTLTLQKSTSSNSGVSYGPYSNAGSCTVVNTGVNRTQCQYAATGFVNVGSCTAITPSSGPNYTVSTARLCQYTPYTAWASAGSCLLQPQSPGPTNYTVGVARDCQYVYTAFANVGSCTVVAASPGPNFTVANPVQCQYTAYTAYANAASCLAQAQSPGPNYTVGTARNCQYVYTAFANVGSCTAVAASAGPNYTVANPTQCQYTAWSAWVGAGSCTVQAQSPGPIYTVGTATNCQYAYTAFANVGACTVVAPSAGPSYTVAAPRQCQYTAWSGWANTGACTVAAQSAGPNYTVGTAMQCQYIWSAPVGVPSCNVLAASPGPAYSVSAPRQCQYTAWSALTNTASCTAAPQSTGPSYTVGTARMCQYTAWTAWTNAGSCNALAQSSGPTNYTVGTATQCQYTAWSSWSNVASCTAAAQSGGPSYSVATATQCQYLAWTAWSNAGSTCTAVNQSSGPNYATATRCQYAGWTAWTATQSCTAAAMSAGPAYSVLVARQCQDAVTTSWANSATCAKTTPDVSGNWTDCQYNFAPAAVVQSCSPAFVANNFTNATVYSGCTTSSTAWTNVGACTTATGYDVNGTHTDCQYSAFTSWSNVATCTSIDPSTGPAYTVGLARDCQVLTSGGTLDTLADVAAYYYATDLRSATASGADATGTCTGPIIAPSTTASDLCANNVPPTGRDTNARQHMTTSTLGLGAQGSMVYSQYQNNLSGGRVYVPDYWQQQTGDFYAVSNGSTPNAASGICPWMASGTCTWPTPCSDCQTNIDDLWHAAVNGRGTYFSASDPQSLADSLKSALSTIVNTPRPGTAAAAASSNPNITSSDNYVFSSSYKSVEWYGELIMQQLGSDGTLSAQEWSAMRLLDCTASPWRASYSYSAGAVFSQAGVCYLVKSDYSSSSSFDLSATGGEGVNATVMTGTPGTRTIYMAGSGSTGLKAFTWANLSAAQQAYFQTPAITYVDSTTGLTQFCTVGSACLGAAAQVSAQGSAMVDFLRGDRSNEGTYYRARKHVLGDIVSSEARYVKQPLQGYVDVNYGAFKAAMATRTATVYVGANDGMVHAFNALTGQENWAFIPSAVLPTMYKLADTDYATKHTFFVDGTPEVGDICPNAPSTTCASTEWKTILVGGLNDGGKAYYALDITDPVVPKLLWQFTDTNLGLSYSNARITKLQDGTWAVIVASGYNNADGKGYLYVINAGTGNLIRSISTGTGSTGTPSGLARLAARSPTSATNNTVEEVYGGDALGNVWRFDVNGNLGATGFDAQLMVQLKDPSGNAQSVTAKPTVASVNGFPLVIVGTGRYLGVSDLSDTNTYSMYAFIDRLTGTASPNSTPVLTTPRSSSTFVHQVLNDTTCPVDAPTSLCSSGQQVRTVTSNAVDWSVKDGWYLDFLLGGERSVTDPTLALGTLVFTTIRPQTSGAAAAVVCSTTDIAVGATSYLYYLDYLTGGAIDGTKSVVGNLLCTCVATRPSVVRTQTGNVEGIIRTSGGGAGCVSGTDMGCTTRQDLPYDPGGGVLRRLSWRDLNGQ